jgi:predicted nucleic acid-binding protein
MPATYLDSSAIVKLAVEEPESAVLRRYLRRRTLVSSVLARTEVPRALIGEGAKGLAAGRAVLARLDLIRVNDKVLDAAGQMLPPDLRSLDAIHLATARELGRDLSRLIAYDERLLEGARRLGVPVASPR